MITKNSTVFVLLIVLFASAYGMEDESSISRSLHVERAHPVRKLDKMSLSFILNAPFSNVSGGSASVALSMKTDLASSFIEDAQATSSGLGHRCNHAIAHFKCSVCEESFGCKTKYTEHIRAAHNDFLYQCLICGQLLIHEEWWKHMRETHDFVTERGSFCCSVCKKKFTSRNAPIAHALSKHVELTNLPVGPELQARLLRLIEALALQEKSKSLMLPPA